jgi:hypothetical protein
MSEFVAGAWQDYVEHPYMRKVVAGGIGVMLVAIWTVPWFWGFWR